MLSSLIANTNRDPKKRKTPYNLNDFCLYQPQDEKDLPSYMYGSAAMSALQKGMFPSWALFCFKQLSESSSAQYKPSNPVLLSSDALLLHPEKRGGSWYGMLIACESASGQMREFVDVNGESYKLAVPSIETKYVALEGVTLN